ncbi:MAG: hypothetical protein M1839_001008 [Geoglossum umbratile]|nr:MAG: hypothetical protein M1839_001008 [Geoglossum umbratile]
MDIAGAVLSALGAAARLSKLLVELAGVEDSIVVYRDMLRHDYRMLEAIRDERDRKLHLLEPQFLHQIQQVVRDSEVAWDSINNRVHMPLKKFGKTGSVSPIQRILWVFKDGPAAREVTEYLQMTHTSLTAVWGSLFSIRVDSSPGCPNPPFGDNGAPPDYADVEEDSVGAALRRHHSKHYVKPTRVSVTEVASDGEDDDHHFNIHKSSQFTAATTRDADGYRSDDDFDVGSWIAHHHRSVSKRHSSR